MSKIDFRAIRSPKMAFVVRPKQRDLQLSIDGEIHQMKDIKASAILNAIAEDRPKDTVRHWDFDEYSVTVTAFLNPYSGKTKVKTTVAYQYEAPLYDIVDGERVDAGTMKGTKTIQLKPTVED